MHAPASRRQPSARSRMLSATDSPRAGRGLGDVVTGVVHSVSVVVHDVSDVAHDVGHAVHDALSGQVSKLPGDIVKTGLDFVKTGKDVVEVIHSPPNLSAGHDSGGSGSGSGDQSHTGGGDGGAQPHPAPHPTAVPGSGGGEVAGAPSSSRASSEDPTSAAPLLSSTSPSSEYATSAPSTPASTGADAINVASPPSSGPPPAKPTEPPAQDSIDPEDGQTANGMEPSSAVSAAPSSTTLGALPSNGTGGASAEHRKGFPLAAAAAIGSVLGFLVVSALFWAVWFYLRKRRRVYLPPRRMLSVTSGRTVSTVPLFISASEAGVRDDSKNPFKHPRDADAEEDDPFDAASLWRSSTTRSSSTLSV